MTLQVHIKYFASIREALGYAGETRQTLAVTLEQLRSELLAVSPAHASSLARSRPVRVALNQVMSDESALLVDGCEVAFFPPVTGG